MKEMASPSHFFENPLDKVGIYRVEFFQNMDSLNGPYITCACCSEKKKTYKLKTTVVYFI